MMDVKMMQDALRYRYLRNVDPHNAPYGKGVRCQKEIGRGPCEPDWYDVHGVALDRAVDAAMRASARQGTGDV